MRRYLLDTSPLAALLLARLAAVALVTPWMERHEAAKSILAYAEVVEYIKGRSELASRHAHLRTLLGEVYPYFLTTVSLSAMPTCAVVSDLPTVLDSLATLTPCLPQP